MLQRLDLEKLEAVYLALATLLARLRRSTQDTQITFRILPTQTTIPKMMLSQTRRSVPASQDDFCLLHALLRWLLYARSIKAHNSLMIQLRNKWPQNGPSTIKMNSP